ncbi:MAG TPA: hypothetical protein VGL56_14510 [Fimbriimonadaceae bacterium]|jgi:hypothetical protein
MRLFAVLACLFVALFALPKTAVASDVVQSWAQTFPTTAGEAPDTFTVDAKGSVYIVSFYILGPTGEFWIIRKLNSLGQLQWTQSFVATNRPTQIAVDANGNVFLTSTEGDASSSSALTVKLFSNGDIAWANEYAGGEGQSLHIDSAGNCFVGGGYSNGTAFELLLLEYNNAGQLINHVERADISNPITFFMPNGTLIANGQAEGSTSAYFEAVNSSGTYLFSSVTQNTADDVFHYGLSCDPSSNLYWVVVDRNVNDDNATFTLGCFGPTGMFNWVSASYPGSIDQMTASDPNHAYLLVEVDDTTESAEGFGAGGKRFMDAVAKQGQIAADGTKGLVRETQNTTSFQFGEINTASQTTWSAAYSGVKPEGCEGMAIINSTVYSLCASDVGGIVETSFIKYVQGVGATVITPSATSVQGGNNVSVTVQLNDVAPAGGLAAYFVVNSSALGLPGSVTISPGISSLTVNALTSPVSVSTPVTITVEINGGDRSCSVVLTPAVLSTVTFPGGASASVKGGQTITGTIQLSGKTALISDSVTLASNSAKATVPASVSVQPGTSTATFVVNTTAVTTSTPVVITAKLGGVTVTAKLAVTP